MSTEGRIAQLEHELRLAHARFAGIVQIAADAIISVDADQNITFFNEGAERIFGWTAAEVQGQPLNVLLPARFREGHPRHVREFGGSAEHARRMGHRREISGVTKDGHEFPAEASISRHDVDGRRVYNVVLRDITDRKRIEDEHRFLAGVGEILGASLDYDLTIRGAARLAVPTLGDACTVDVIDGGSLVAFATAHVDPHEERLLLEMRSRHLPDLAGPHPLAQAVRERRTVLVDATDEVLRSLARNEEHLAMLRRLGFAAFLYVPMLVGGEPVGVLRLARARQAFAREDVALAEEFVRRLALAMDNVRLYERAQQAIRARDETISVVSHDLRNPVNAIRMIASSLLASRPAGSTVEEYLHTIADAARQCDALIQDLLDVSRIEAGRLRIDPLPSELSTLVHGAVEVLTPLAAERGIVLEADVPETLPVVLADEQRVQQVLSNLVGNAVKFTPAGGRVTVRVELGRPPAHEVVVAVADTGPGIPPADLPAIFDRYWQGSGRARRAGAGLGLPIAKGIVDAHGGRLWVESEVGRGSVFRFTLRVAGR
mgnify:CR=1 FL=1